MKKLLYSIAILAILCFAAGCQREVDIDPVKGELVETEFVVTLDDATVTKAAINNNAANIDKLYIAAFKTSDGSYLSEISEENENFVIQPVATNNEGHKQFAVKLKLVRNYAYTLGFFAYHNGAPYAIGNDGTITMSTPDGTLANVETLDAFFAKADVTLDPATPESLAQTITLIRPLAQINVLSNPNDWAAAQYAGFTSGLKSSITIAGAPNKINLLDGSVSGSATLTYGVNDIPDGTLNVAAANATAVNAKYIAMGYVLSTETGAGNVTVTFSVPANGPDFGGFEREVQNVPNKSNYRTNLHGDLFTTEGNFTVVLSEGLGNGDTNQDINIPQPTVSPLGSIPTGISTANPGIQQPTIDTGNNVTTNLADGKLFFGIDTNSDGAITYSSSDHNVGTIDNDGVFTPVGPGTTNITVTQAAGTQTKAIGDPLAEITIVYHVTVVETTYAISKNTPENGTLAIKIGENEVTEAAAAATITVATEPAAGYELATLTYTPEGESPVDIKAVGSFTMPAKAVAVNATFEVIPPDEYAITVTQPGNGNVIAASAESAEENTEITLSVTTTATGYEFTSWTVTTASSANVTVTDNKFSMPAEAVTVTATFSKINYTITKNAVENGSITVSSETANYGDEISLVATPADGYSFGTWDVKQGETVITVTDNKFTMPAGNVTVGATFTQNAPTKYDVIVDDATVNGTVSADKAEAAAGETVTLTITPADYYELDVLTVEDENNQAVTVNNNQFAMPEGGVTVTATFKKLKYAVTISTMTNGTVTVDETPAEWGATVILTVTPDTGYQLVENSLTVASGVNDLLDMDNGEWAFTMPKNAVTVSAEFGATTPVYQYVGSGTADDPYTVADVRHFIDELGDAGTVSNDEVYVVGVIKSIVDNGQFNSTYHNASFIITENGNDGDEFEAYRVKYVTNRNWETGDETIAVGDDVIVCGKVKLYNTTYETHQATGNNAYSGYLYSLNGKTEVTQSPTISGANNATEVPAGEGTLSITITSESGSAIYYTTDGSDPTVSSQSYSSAFTINAACTIKAIAVKDGKCRSLPASQAFTKAGGAISIEASVASICSSSGYNSYSNDDWIVTCGSNNGSFGCNSNNADTKMMLGDNYVVATALDENIASDSTHYAALISKNKLTAGITKITLGGTIGTGMTVGVTISSDGTTWTKLADFGSDTEFTFTDQGSVYYAIVIHANNKTNARYTSFTATFSNQ